MASFPSHVCTLVAGYGEESDPNVLRTEMERGPPKQRLVSSRMMVKLRCVLLFNSTDDVGEFDDWYFDTIGRIGQFTVAHPRTGATITANFEGGAIGPLTPVNNNRRRWRREVVIEYLR